ncbi:hypothetical protein EDC94DRAFT_317011 [Helicostylum pulchrum]|nr:hypothetical protein EDC94DRAFT_317011 [Helicostylum pulchrum]
MKFSTCVVSALCVFVASCSAACSCSSSDQACMDKCVLAANSCIVQCKDGGDACQKACISSHWPASPVSQKDVLASTVGSAVTSADASVPTGSSHSETVHVYSTTSGGSAIIVTSTIKASATNARNNPSATPTKADGTPVGNSAGNLSRQMTPIAVAMAGVMVMVSWIL